MRVLIPLFFMAFPCWGEFIYLNRSSKGLLMGDAYTAVADDDHTLFYNPAALGRHRGVTLSILNPKAETTDILEKDVRKFKFKTADKYRNWPKSPEEIAGRVLGSPFHLSAGVSPSIKIEHFGLTFLANTKLKMILENAIHPNIDLDYRLDRGFLVGYAKRFGSQKSYTSLGMGIKSINRQGLRGRYDLFGTQLVKLTENAEDYRDIRSELGYSKGKAWGFDVGMEQVFLSPGKSIVVGASYLNIGEMHFKEEEGTGDIPDQDSSLNLGFSYSQDLPILDYTLAVDYKNIIDPVGDHKGKFSVGLRLKFPFLTTYLGQREGYTSYGIGIDFFMFEVLAGFYSSETGYAYREREGKRALILVKLLSTSFGQ